jgi:UDP-N-acetylglucosamine 2-epimerase (non-hydrolysing)
MERPEALDTGSIIITGLDPDTVVAAVDRAISDFRSGHLPPVPQDYTVTNTAQRVVRLVLGTAKLNARWHGLDPIHQ